MHSTIIRNYLKIMPISQKENSTDGTTSARAHMVNAIDLEAEVNFVAFTIGVTIDLAELNQGKKVRITESETTSEDTSLPPTPDSDP